MEQMRAWAREELHRRLSPGATAADVEDVARKLSQELFGPVVGQELTRLAAEVPHRGLRCGVCGNALRVVDRRRRRQLTGVQGESVLERPYLHCSHCGVGYAPADQVLGVGAGAWMPSLTRAAARLGIEVSFETAAEALAEALGVPVPTEDVRRATEGIGAVAEAEEQAAVDRAKQCKEQPGEADSDTLVVAVDGCMVHVGKAWHEMKVGVCAPLGPECEQDPDTGQMRLALGQQQFCTGQEDAEQFWYRLYALVVAMGLGGRQVRRVIVLGDGAEWIWRRAAAFLGVVGVEVIEIVDLWHARQHLWHVAHAVFGEGSAEAAAWAEPMAKALLDEGVSPVLNAIRTLQPRTEAAQEVVRLALEYFGDHAPRMRYPEFALAGWPVGSGMVESACKLVVAARQKGAGMRWGGIGCQSVATLRAVHRSGQWDRFWQRLPHMRRPLARHLVNPAA